MKLSHRRLLHLATGAAARPAVLRIAWALGKTGIEIVVWSTVAFAAFLPSILLDWRAIIMRPATKQTMTMALEHG